jgi:hypothetical protein
VVFGSGNCPFYLFQRQTLQVKRAVTNLSQLLAEHYFHAEIRIFT